LNWLLRELGGTTAPNNQTHSDHHGSLSALEQLTLRIRPQSSVREVAIVHARALSDVLANEQRYPHLKRVRLEVIPQHLFFEWTSEEDVAGEGRHKEEIARAVQALDEKGILQLRWTQK
jgi:hypothetical protein